jgi:hypothetical protein
MKVGEALLDYRVDFLDEDQASAGWFNAENDVEAFRKALRLYKAHATFKGFKLWEQAQGRLVYSEPGREQGSEGLHFAF